MNILRLVGLKIVLLAASVSSSYAGPCTSQIEQTAIRIEAKLGAKAAGGPGAAESAGALLHRQPTPKSIATAEEAVGELSSETVSRVSEAMARARAADEAGDTKTCAEALSEAQKAIGP